jgi:hypothetical protein
LIVEPTQIAHQKRNVLTSNVKILVLSRIHVKTPQNALFEIMNQTAHVHLDLEDPEELPVLKLTLVAQLIVNVTQNSLVSIQSVSHHVKPPTHAD